MCIRDRLNTDKIYFYPYKIFEVERRKYLYTIYARGLFEIDNTVSKLLQLNGSKMCIRDRVRAYE